MSLGTRPGVPLGPPEMAGARATGQGFRVWAVVLDLAATPRLGRRTPTLCHEADPGLRFTPAVWDKCGRAAHATPSWTLSVGTRPGAPMGPPEVAGPPACRQAVVLQEENFPVSARGSLETWGLGFNGMLTLFARLRMLLAQHATASHNNRAPR